MIHVRRSAQRGHVNHGWLDTYHTFSFGSYHDPEQMGFRALRVINEDRIQPASGFGTHPHRDMEILTYIVSGALEHRDSMGSGSVIRRGDVQRMSAGTGVLHSERNPSPSEAAHLLQIWILPDRPGHRPDYEERHYPHEDRQGRLLLVASPDGRDGSLSIHQDAWVYASLLDPGSEIEHPTIPGRYGWVQVVRGTLELNGEHLGTGDGAGFEMDSRLVLKASESSELLLFDLN